MKQRLVKPHNFKHITDEFKLFELTLFALVVPECLPRMHSRASIYFNIVMAYPYRLDTGNNWYQQSIAVNRLRSISICFIIQRFILCFTSATQEQKLGRIKSYGQIRDQDKLKYEAKLFNIIIKLVLVTILIFIEAYSFQRGFFEKASYLKMAGWLG